MTISNLIHSTLAFFFYLKNVADKIHNGTSLQIYGFCIKIRISVMKSTLKLM